MISGESAINALSTCNKYCILFLSLLFRNLHAQPIAHLILRRELQCDNYVRDYYTKENKRSFYIDGKIYLQTYGKGDPANYNELNSGKDNLQILYFHKGPLRSHVVVKTPTGTSASIHYLKFRPDSLIAEEIKNDKLYRRHFYDDQKNYTGYIAYQTDKKDPKQQIEWFRCLLDTSNKKKNDFLFQSCKEGIYESPTHISIDSIKIRNKSLQFLVLNHDPAKKEIMYDKYVFNADGSFNYYENWSKESYEYAKRRNLRVKFFNDRFGRPIFSKDNYGEYSLWSYEDECPWRDTALKRTLVHAGKKNVLSSPRPLRIYTGPYHGAKDDTVSRFISESSKTDSLNCLTTFSAKKLQLKKTGSLLFVDWCMDTGDESSLIIIRKKDLRAVYYQDFEFGQIYFSSSVLDEGACYFIVAICRQKSVGLFTEYVHGN